ncbi:hypothetical protein [Brevibacterium sediminis]|uniref:hypothetical protein n=1 Tax=Brevibacterium sediminis TaxID=1857024 RepID=UPI003B3A2164
MFSEHTHSATTTASPLRAYQVIAEIGDYDSWLPKSGSYRGTVVGTDRREALVGDTYADCTTLGIVFGKVIIAEPGKLIGFRQQTSDESLRIGITYRIIADQLLTTILRTGRIEITGRLRPLALFIVPAIRRENARTMRHLKAHLDSESS